MSKISYVLKFPLFLQTPFVKPSKRRLINHINTQIALIISHQWMDGKYSLSKKHIYLLFPDLNKGIKGKWGVFEEIKKKSGYISEFFPKIYVHLISSYCVACCNILAHLLAGVDLLVPICHFRNALAGRCNSLRWLFL